MLAVRFKEVVAAAAAAAAVAGFFFGVVVGGGGLWCWHCWRCDVGKSGG